ncbi:uncharacterized protein F5891DRAFT_985148 [Suillus fuscotomentosus]|uniref:Uncharacterized protein n=1 Tax=Suillus fuscotomentosus TaxID=1912939 RepID=A0AAD4DUN4_9AGAM|nr:uncharacterized protein F5891DRAFT_985148 [Suillus fuscotomentosus]KAG1894260.1 hypothetical protein F5891DRAFT_985148 [Suillus fuscotomentosus]
MNFFPSQFVMIPQEAANDALETTLADMQSLMKCCMKLKEANPETLRLSDEITRRVAKDLKLYAGNATSFSPLLLSCTAIIWQYSKSGAFESVPDWTSVAEDDPRIKDHLRFEKTMDYRPPFALDVSLLATSSTIPTTFPTSLPALDNLSSCINNPSCMDLDLVTKLVEEPKQSSRPRVLKNLPPLCCLAHPPLRYYHLYVAEAEREHWKALVMAGDSKKRKACDEDTDGAVVIETLKLPSSPQEPLKKKRKLMSDAPTGIIDVKPKALPSVAPDKAGPPGNDQGFWHSDIQPAEWGSDDCIATPFQHSVHFHPQKCDKCTKMDIPCIVLPDKKFGCMRLVCANCDLMKVTCVIVSIGMRKIMQGKVSVVSLNSAKHSRMCIRKSYVISPVILNIAEEVEQQPGLPADVPIKTLAINSTSQQPKWGDQFAPTNHADPKPTARDILQGIQDLGRRFDLLATNERLDTLDVRVRSVETIIHQHFDALEQCLNALDACDNESFETPDYGMMIMADDFLSVITMCIIVDGTRMVHPSDMYINVGSGSTFVSNFVLYFITRFFVSVAPVASVKLVSGTKPKNILLGTTVGPSEI